MSDHLIAEANRHAKALHQMTLPTTKPNHRDIDWYIAECIDLRRQLQYEMEAKRNHLRIAIKEISDLKVKTGFYYSEIARLRTDQMRVDWIAQAPDKRLSAVHNIWVNDGDIADVRSAIDAAMKGTP